MRGIDRTDGKKSAWYKRFNPFSAALFLLFAAVLGFGFTRSAFYAEKKDTLVYVFQEASLSAGLRLDDVFVTGRKRTPRKELLDSLNITRGMPILAVDIHSVREKIQRLPWVKTVKIERRLPRHLYIAIQERTPVAVWQHKGRYRPIDSEGQLIETTVRKLNGLPLIVGPEAPEKTPELLEILRQEPELLKRVKAASHIGKRRWNIILDDLNRGITVRLPEKDPATAWGRLARLERTQGILKRKITMIDLRLPDKLTVRLEEDLKKKKKPAVRRIPDSMKTTSPI